MLSRFLPTAPAAGVPPVPPDLSADDLNKLPMNFSISQLPFLARFNRSSITRPFPPPPPRRPAYSVSRPIPVHQCLPLPRRRR